MKHVIAIFAVAFPLVMTANSYPQSLGDLAKKEKERRQQIKAEVKVITNKDAPRSNSGSEAPAPSAPPAPASGQSKVTAVKPGTAKPDSDEPVDFQGRPESWWRQTMTDARKKVKDLENEGNVITLKIADLQNQFYRESDGFKQQDIQRQISKAFYEQDLNKENFAKAKRELEDIEKEARRSGALPGWLNPKTP